MSASPVKYQACYDLISKYIESIPIKKIEDFDKLLNTLRSMADGNFSELKLKRRVSPIKHWLQHPESFVESNQIEEFKTFVRNQILIKIGGIAYLTKNDKESYLANQQKAPREARGVELPFFKKHVPGDSTRYSHDEDSPWGPLDLTDPTSKLFHDIATRYFNNSSF